MFFNAHSSCVRLITRGGATRTTVWWVSLVRIPRASSRMATSRALAQAQSVGVQALVVAREQPTCAPQPGLDFVGDEQHLVPAADAFACGEIAARRDDDALLALNRLDQKRRGARRDRALEGLRVAE